MTRREFDLDELLSPADAFGHPSEVVHDPDLTLGEKRAILASWASDACAIEAASHLRPSAAGRMVSFDAIMDALRELDRESAQSLDERSRKARRIRTILGKASDDSGGSLQN